MNITLLISIAIFASCVAGVFFYDRVNRFLDSNLRQLGQGANIVKYGLFALAAVLAVASGYSLYEWVRVGSIVSIQDSLNDLRGDLMAGVDRVGDEIGQYENGDATAASSSAIGKASSNLGAQSSSLLSVLNGRQYGHMGGSQAMDNLLERYHTPRFDPQIGSNCSRTYKNAGACDGVSRLFRDDAQMINSCNKLQVVAPQLFPNNDAVRFAL